MTNQELVEMAEKVYGKCDWHGDALAHLEQFAKLIAEHERKACINIAENYWNNCLSQAPQGTFLTSKKVSDRNYSEGIIQGAKGLVTVLKSSDQENIYSTKIF